ncbi:helix-turn-helix domain-containing protein [Pseudonocardia nigra]|uniref:helix-turn-helix domain-containing protein n=1 Tax=Pseudonocardia nigra TaxID=1921578 RepID=UPI001C5EAF4D|nr:helix-turn-helix domain-containing protein [Pseudonocardia nigra]
MDDSRQHTVLDGQPANEHVGLEAAPVLYTAGQAANLLQVRESWLRRRAAQRLVPCTFLGKHLRFSRADLEQIVADAARPAVGARRSSRSDTGAAHRPLRQSHSGSRTGSRRFA